MVESSSTPTTIFKTRRAYCCLLLYNCVMVVELGWSLYYLGDAIRLDVQYKKEMSDGTSQEGDLRWLDAARQYLFSIPLLWFWLFRMCSHYRFWNKLYNWVPGTTGRKDKCCCCPCCSVEITWTCLLVPFVAGSVTIATAETWNNDDNKASALRALAWTISVWETLAFFLGIYIILYVRGRNRIKSAH